MQSKIDKPMKKLCNKKLGEYGNVFDLEKVFESGYVPKHRIRSDTEWPIRKIMITSMRNY